MVEERRGPEIVPASTAGDRVEAADRAAIALDVLERKLLNVMADYGRLAVAFSAGVDSTVVAKAAAVACGDRAVAATAESPSLGAGELDEARALAEQIGIRHVVIRTAEFDDPDYTRNPANRCFFCKTELYSRLAELRETLDFDVIVNGANLDDLGDHRPGMIAARDHAVRSPLVEAGLTKADVRALARKWDLPVWDKPAAPCLSSRIAYGVEVTPERVRRIDAAERFLRELLGVRELRVRLEAGELARIEAPLSMLVEITAEGTTARVVGRLREFGFRRVTLDLEGFRSGSMNEAIPTASLVQLNR